MCNELRITLGILTAFTVNTVALKIFEIIIHQ